MRDPRLSLKKLYEAFNRHDLDQITSLFTDECVLEMRREDRAWGQRYASKDAVRQAFAGRFEGLPDVHYGDE